MTGAVSKLVKCRRNQYEYNCVNNYILKSKLFIAFACVLGSAGAFAQVNNVPDLPSFAISGFATVAADGLTGTTGGGVVQQMRVPSLRCLGVAMEHGPGDADALAMAVTLAIPFLLRPKGEAAPRNARTLVIISPHNEAVLREIGAERRPVITVFNKTDLLTDPLARQRIRRRFRDAIFISARTGDGFDALLERLAAQVAHGRRRLELLLPHARGDLLAQLHRACRVLDENFTDTGAEISAEVPLSLLPAFEPFLRPATPPGAAPEPSEDAEG